MVLALSREEQETVMRCSAADEVWDIVTADPRMKTKMRKAGYEGKPDHQLSAPYEKFEVPFEALTIRSLAGIEAKREAGRRRGMPEGLRKAIQAKKGLTGKAPEETES